MVSPNAGPGKEDKLLHPDDHLIWCSKVDSGPRKTQKQKIPTKSGVTGSAYLHSMGSMAPGGGGGTPPPSRGGPPDDKRDDESGEEENEEDDTDEETVSVTSSSQGSVSRARPLIWSSG